MDKSSEGIIFMQDKHIQYINDKFIEQHLDILTGINLSTDGSYYHKSHQKNKCVNILKAICCNKKTIENNNKLN